MLSIALILATTSTSASPLPETEATQANEHPFGLGRFGPFELTSPDGSSLGLHFLGQLRFVYSDRAGSPRRRSEELIFQRVRTILKARLFGDRLSFRLQLNLGPTRLEFLDYFLRLRLLRDIYIAAGQMKLPLDHHRLSSVARLTLSDWSRSARFFGGERQIGLLMNNQLSREESVGWVWAVGVFGGVNARRAFGTGVAQVYGISLANPSDLVDPADPTDIHPEIVARLGARFGADSWSGDSDASGGPPRWRLGVGAAWDTAPVVGQDFAFRLHPEAAFKAYHLSASAQGYLGFIEPSSDRPLTLGALGVNVQLAWRFFPFLEVAARSTHVRVLEAMRDDAVLAQLVEAPRPLSADDELTLGMTFYAIGDALKLASDFSVRWRTFDTETRRDYQVRSQLQLMF